METIINFILEAAISLGLLSLYYLVVSRKYNTPRFNRYFLVFALIFSVIVPFIHISFVTAAPTTDAAIGNAFVMLDMVTIYADVMSQNVVPAVNQSHSVRIIYLIGFIVLAIRLIWALIKLNILSGKSKITRVNGIRVIITGNNYQAFTFLQSVFIPIDVWESAHKKEVLIHESIHVQQNHSIDLVLFELILLIQWFNPFAWLMRRLMQENHEFLADRAVIDTGIDVKAYQKLLLYEVMGIRFELGNNFNHSLTKKRFKMMTLQVNRKQGMLSSIFSMAVIAGIFSFLAFDISAGTLEESAPMQNSTFERFIIDESTPIVLQQSEVEDTFMVVEQMPQFAGGQKALMTYLSSHVVYPPEAHKNGIQGRVYLTFVVLKNGKLGAVKIKRGVDPLLDAEAIRVVKSMPAWTPGEQRGKTVNVRFTLPINFVLK